MKKKEEEVKSWLINTIKKAIKRKDIDEVNKLKDLALPHEKKTIKKLMEKLK